MKQTLFFLLGVTCISFIQLQAQNWVNGGNTLSANGTLGTNSNHSLLFETNATERGRITNGGNWAIGSTGTTSRFTVNSVAGASPFRAQVNGSTKLLVNSNGSLSIGSSTAGPANGLYVAGNVGIGTATPSQKLHVVGSGLFTTGLTVSSGTVGSSTNYGSAIYGSSPNGYGVHGTSTNSYGVYAISGYIGAYGDGISYGVYGNSSNVGVNGNSASNTGVSGSGGVYGVKGFSAGSYGVYGSSNEGTGVYGYSYNRKGGYFVSQNEIALWARSNRADKNWAGVFEGNVYTYNAYQTSDKNVKKNIEDLGDAIGIINKLKPKSYEFRRDGKLANLNLPRGRHYGVLAQDLEEVLPNLVMELENDVSDPARMESDTALVSAPQKETAEKITIKSVNYTELIPVMIRAIQEQQQMIDKQQQQIDELNALVHRLTNSGSINAGLNSAYLSSISPNPVKGTASIQYAIPEGSNRAQLLITDVLGRQIKAIQLAKSGTIKVNVASLAAGVYHYSLVVDNKTVDTKKMTVVH